MEGGTEGGGAWGCNVGMRGRGHGDEGVTWGRRGTWGLRV